MYLDQSQQIAPHQGLNISSKLIESITILQYSAEELHQAAARELDENPAFEMDEHDQCPRCGAPLQAARCPACDMAPAPVETSAATPDEQDWDDFRQIESGDLARVWDSEAVDPLTFARAGDTLPEHLLLQLGTLLPWADQSIAEYLVGNLDSHGYLAGSLVEAADVLEVPLERVERVLAALQTLDPAGIGARTLGECLLIQLRAFRERGQAQPLAEQLAEHHLAALGEHHFLEIARELGVTSTQVKRAWRFIKANLNPFPAHAFAGGAMPGMDVADGARRAVLVKPDVVIRRAADGFEVEVVEERRYRFGIHPAYQQLARNGRQRGLRDDERQHVRHYAARARFFIECVAQRWATLRRICEALVELQPEFLAKGVHFLRPLTRGDLAERVALHESTISRATADKYVLLPSGRTIPFDDFFDASLATKETLRELIEAENPAQPLSDEDLSELLSARGIPVARRTVAKYREALRILPSRFRI
jgi:RNA polymerase sigma-54 factor